MAALKERSVIFYTLLGAVQFELSSISVKCKLHLESYSIARSE
jgi:hypothetical protein